MRDQAADALVDKDWKRKLDDEDRENNQPKKRKSFEAKYDQRLDAKFPVYRQARETLRAGGYSDDQIDALRKAGWSEIEKALAELTKNSFPTSSATSSTPSQPAQPFQPFDEAGYKARVNCLLAEGLDEWEASKIASSEFGRTSSALKPVDPQPPQHNVTAPQPLPSPQDYSAPGYGMRISNSPDPQSLKLIDQRWRHPIIPKPKFDAEFESPIISELARMTPAEGALKMDDPNFASRLKAHRDSLW